MQLFAGELTNQNREYYKVNDNLANYAMIVNKWLRARDFGEVIVNKGEAGSTIVSWKSKANNLIAVANEI